MASGGVVCNGNSGLSQRGADAARDRNACKIMNHESAKIRKRESNSVMPFFMHFAFSHFRAFAIQKSKLDALRFAVRESIVDNRRNPFLH
jgi:hypothetical protein